MERPIEIDSASSKVTLWTRAEGMFSALAHDLELRCKGLTGGVSLDGQVVDLEVLVPTSGIEVGGVLKGDHVDEVALKASDRQEILKKVRSEVLGASAVTLRYRGRVPEDFTRSFDLDTTINGKAAQIHTHARMLKPSEAEFRVEGSGEVSMKAFAIKPVKGPLGAFRVKDKVEVRFDLLFRAPG